MMDYTPFHSPTPVDTFEEAYRARTRRRLPEWVAPPQFRRWLAGLPRE
jgi:hypothetical protein